MVFNVHKHFVDLEPNSPLLGCGLDLFTGPTVAVQCVTLDCDFLLVLTLRSLTLGSHAVRTLRQPCGRTHLAMN